VIRTWYTRGKISITAPAVVAMDAGRVRRDGDGGTLTDVREVLDEARPHCPWCEDELDDKGECSRRCRASRVQREG
jgi:hypothetical protein